MGTDPEAKIDARPMATAVGNVLGPAGNIIGVGPRRSGLDIGLKSHGLAEGLSGNIIGIDLERNGLDILGLKRNGLAILDLVRNDLVVLDQAGNIIGVGLRRNGLDIGLKRNVPDLAGNIISIGLGRNGLVIGQKSHGLAIGLAGNTVGLEGNAQKTSFHQEDTQGKGGLGRGGQTGARTGKEGQGHIQNTPQSRAGLLGQAGRGDRGVMGRSDHRRRP